jgi:hypothetical protein
MNNYEQIHETVIRDVVDVLMDVKNEDSLQGVIGNKNSFKSIASASAPLTIVFPVPASKSISIDAQSMTCKAIERKGVSMLQMLFAAMNISGANDAIEYVSKFHTNLNMSDGDLSVDEFIGMMDKYVVEHESAGIPVINDHDLYNAIKEDFKNLKYALPPIKETASINQYKVYSEYAHGNNNIVLEAGPYDDANKFSGTLKNMSDVIKNQIVDSDIKKANELVPTIMIVNFVSTKNGTGIATQAIIGVKAKLYPVDSADIVQRIVAKNKDGNGLNKFIRATTREISFWKDLVFAIDKAKLDALSNSNRGSSSKIWKLLERRALKSKARRFLGMTNDATAITSLVISQEEVEYLKKTENIDVEKPQVVSQIMDAYNLMSFIIVDEAMEVVKFLFDDGSNHYETLSFSYLERETSDGGYKKVINLMTKMTR